MITKNIITITISLLITFPSNSLEVGQRTALENYFKVEIVQNGEVIKEIDNVIQLEKKPFKFRLTFYKTQDVFVSLSWGTYYYNYPSNKNIFECNDDSYFNDCRFVSIKAGNEDKFNVNKDIYVGDGDYQSVWFYDEKVDWYRMDKGVTVKDGIVYSEVTVENIYDMDKRDSRNFEESDFNYPINEINQDIYVVFANDFYEKGMKHPKELQREKFILKFK